MTGIEMYGNFTDETDLRNLYAQADTMEMKYRELGKMCTEHSEGKHLQYVGTAATARDMVALADALDVFKEADESSDPGHARRSIENCMRQIDEWWIRVQPTLSEESTVSESAV